MCLLGIGLCENTHDLVLKFRELHGHDRAVWMQDQVASGRQQVQMTPEHVAQTALDAIALVRLSEHLADGKSNARSCAVFLPGSWSWSGACGRQHRRAESPHARAA